MAETLLLDNNQGITPTELACELDMAIPSNTKL